MRIYYGTDPIDNDVLDSYEHSIFLAGPTPRSEEVESWRPKACEILNDLGYKGLVFAPEPEGDVFPDYMNQVTWEKWGLTSCDKIAFWIPRVIPTMPAFTTNVEFGKYIDSGKVVYGRPDWATKCRYLDWLYKDVTGKEAFSDLKELLVETIRFN